MLLVVAAVVSLAHQWLVMAEVSDAVLLVQWLGMVRPLVCAAPLMVVTASA